MILGQVTHSRLGGEAMRLAAAALFSGAAMAFLLLGAITMQMSGDVLCLVNPGTTHCAWCLAGLASALSAILMLAWQTPEATKPTAP